MRPLAKSYTVTLEESKTGKADSSDWQRGTVPLDLPIGTVSGVFDNSAGTGTNYWTAYNGNIFSDNWLQLSSAAYTALGDDTACYVTYTTGNSFSHVLGVPMSGVNAYAQVTVPTVLDSVTAENDYGTPVSYEISGLTTGQTLAAAIPFVPPVNGVVITQIEVNTDGTNVAIGIYEGTATTGTTLNIKFSKSAINQLYNSSTEYPDLRIVIQDDAWRLGVVDTGANATPAGTKVTVRGYILV